MSRRVAVMVLNWNGHRHGHLQRFLPSVCANLPDFAEVWVADNGSEDGSVEYLSAEWPGVRVLELGGNFGYAGGYNLALSNMCFSNIDYFILLNSDVQTPAGWVEPLVAALDSDSGLAAVQPKILSLAEPSKFEYAGASGGFLDGLGFPFCRGRIVSAIEDDRGQYDDSRDIFWASGACLAVRRGAFFEVGGFDGDFFAHMEEVDFCWRLWLHGWRVGVAPSSRVFHLGGGTLTVGNPHKTFLNFRNSLWMLGKNLSRRSLWPTLCARAIVDSLLALIYFIIGQREHSAAVLRAWCELWRHRNTLKIKRQAIQTSRNARSIPKNLMWRGSILLRFAVGLRRFGRML